MIAYGFQINYNWNLINNTLHFGQDIRDRNENSHTRTAFCVWFVWKSTCTYHDESTLKYELSVFAQTWDESASSAIINLYFNINWCSYISAFQHTINVDWNMCNCYYVYIMHAWHGIVVPFQSDRNLSGDQYLRCQTYETYTRTETETERGWERDTKKCGFDSII